MLRGRGVFLLFTSYCNEETQRGKETKTANVIRRKRYDRVYYPKVLILKREENKLKRKGHAVTVIVTIQ